MPEEPLVGAMLGRDHSSTPFGEDDGTPPCLIDYEACGKRMEHARFDNTPAGHGAAGLLRDP
ncbi:hypothetical protein Sviol_45210 [Streptomyces violascens]|uniref:Uncharacterized protein n=1 Tax=Streptomyces violascens TaxID=67381 RepID=A0ABQ3QS91_9ACTN|nr:hypothetical protein Sviol_45210 [Streptomyces violascens]